MFSKYDLLFASNNVWYIQPAWPIVGCAAGWEVQHFVSSAFSHYSFTNSPKQTNISTKYGWSCQQKRCRVICASETHKKSSISCVTDSTLGHSGLDATEKNPNPEVHYRSAIVFPVVDRVIQEMERQFSGDLKVPLLKKEPSACHPEAAEFLDINALRPLVEAYNLNSRGKLMSQRERERERDLQAAYRGNL